MSQSVKNFILQFYILIKRDFWIINLANISIGIILASFDLHVLIQAIAIAFLFFKTISFVRNSNIMPSISADFDRFSWKYFQGLPLSKNDLIKALVVTNAIVIAPLLVWVLAFFGQISELFFEEKSYVISNSILVILYSIPAIIVIGLTAINNQITFPRRQYSKNDPRKVFYYNVTIFLAVITLGIYGIFGYIWFEREYNIELFKKLYNSMPAISDGFKLWASPFILMGISFFIYKNTLRIWQTEKIGYIKINWEPKKGFSAMAISAFLLTFPFQSGDVIYPPEFQGPLHIAVYRSQYKKIDELLAQGHDINKTNKFGVAPVHIAVYMSNIKMFEYLESKGADIKKEFKTAKGSSSIMHIAAKSNEPKIVEKLILKNLDINARNEVGSTPLHLAANTCRSEVIDLLIEKGAKVDVQNKRAETPLHYAAKKGCFTGVTSLVEANANLLNKDEKGKSALDYAKKSKGDLAYYLEKKSRAPASKITP